MVIYDAIKKNNKIAVFNNFSNILETVTDTLENEEFNFEVYEDIDKLVSKVIKGKQKIVVLLKIDYEIIDRLNKESSVNIIVLNSDNEVVDYKKIKKVNIQSITDVQGLTTELNFALRLVAQLGKVDYQKFKLDIVSNLVESISHKIQANLLTIGASQDVIKMVSEDGKISQNKEKKKIVEDLYYKNDIALQKANSLLQLMSGATNISSESIMKSEDIFDTIQVITDEIVKENEVNLKYNIKLKENAYICGPLNDVIFVICKILKEIINYNEKDLTINMYEDEEKWFFDIVCQENLENREIMYEIYRYLVYINNTGGKIKGNTFSIYIKKIKE